MCTILNNYVPVRPWFDDVDGEEQWGYGYTDDMIAQFKQNLYNKIFSLQNQGKCDQIDTLQNRIKLWLNVIDNSGGPKPDNVYDYEYNDPGMNNHFRRTER